MYLIGFALGAVPAYVILSIVEAERRRSYPVLGKLLVSFGFGLLSLAFLIEVFWRFPIGGLDPDCVWPLGVSALPVVVVGLYYISRRARPRSCIES